MCDYDGSGRRQQAVRDFLVIRSFSSWNWHGLTTCAQGCELEKLVGIFFAEQRANFALRSIFAY